MFERKFENHTIKLSAKETKWTGSGVRACFSILLLLILKYSVRPVKLARIPRTGPWPNVMAKTLNSLNSLNSHSASLHPGVYML